MLRSLLCQLSLYSAKNTCYEDSKNNTRQKYPRCCMCLQLAFTKVNSLEKAPGRGAGEPVRDAAQTSLPRCEVEAGSRTTRGIPSRRKSFGGQTQRARP